MTPASFRTIAPTIPHQPGVYRYYDSKGTVIYVGKAKDLRKRVSSYFTKTFTGNKTQELVKNIHRIEFTVVDSEQDALFLENALIKEYHPRYNIDLKDDKSFPFIVIKKEPFPRVFLTRRRINDGSEYIGPFTSVARVRELLDLIRQHIQLRNCKLSLTDRNIKAGKFKVCLEYHLGNCKGPCEGLQDAADYNEGLQQLKQVVKGRVSGVMQYYKQQMQEHISRMEFEKAEMVRKRIEHLENYSARSVVVSAQLGDIDVFAMTREQEEAYINYMMVRNGTIVQAHSSKLATKLDETDEEVLSFGISNLRSTFESDASEIVVPMAIEFPATGIKVTVPRSGAKMRLLELSQKNVASFKEEQRRKRILHLEEQTKGSMKEVLRKLKEDMHLPKVPVHIECFDNSNFQGAYPVSAMVCFKDGLPSKNDYRRFNVKDIKGINDFATMREVVYRRYKRCVDEHLPLPQLVIIDGGKGQLSAAMESIRSLQLEHQMTIVGLAKNEEEIFFPNDGQSLKLDPRGESLNLIKRIRDEVHRFGITFHRDQRSKGTFTNELEKIPGIGEATATLLLDHFRSVKKIREASTEDLELLIGKKKTAVLQAHLQDA